MGSRPRNHQEAAAVPFSFPLPVRFRHGPWFTERFWIVSDTAMSKVYTRKNLCAAAIVFALTCAGYSSGRASSQYTPRQLEAFEDRIGKTYWTASADNHDLTVLSTPAPNASSFRPPADEAFEITQLVGQKTPHLFYKVKFASGKEGFISPDNFLEELNVTILTADPKADEKRKAAAAAEEEKNRAEWIRSQPWSQAVKDAAIKKQVVSGMNTDEVKKVLGNPTRVSRIKGPQAISEEQWFYPDGNVLVFTNGLLSRVERKRE